MCGISGFINIEIESNDFINIASHRGPDDQGIYRNANVILGHNRLSIQDLSANGHQPFISKDGKFVLVFNGEIYNHWEIRKELIEKGYDFFSVSDTETLLNGYRHFGKLVLNKLNGIFSFAIYDRERDELFMARDQFGVKPFYYYHKGSEFAFASEFKSIRHMTSFDDKIEYNSFPNYLNFLWSPGVTTPFNYLKKLLPGHYICLNLRNEGFPVNPIKYYEIPFAGKYTNLNEASIINELDNHLQDAVKCQMLSDVPVGFFLSGGLDSSLLVAIARKLYPKEKLQAFTIRTEVENGNDGFVDDLFYAKKVAKHLNVDLEIVDAKIDILKDFDKMIWHLEEPQADPAPLNVLNISRRAVEMGFKVLIGGTGGDDVFSGYRRHQALNYERYFHLIPLMARKFLKACISRIPNMNSTTRRIKKISMDLDKTKIERLVGYYSWLSNKSLYELLSADIKKHLLKNKPTDYLVSLIHNIPEEKNWLNRMLFWEMRSFLVDHNLNYTDKMSMAVGVETRVPFLDKRIVDFSTIIPPNLKLKGNETKYILKKVAERYLPKEVIYRKKAGFGAPIREWIKNDLDEMIYDRLSPEKIRTRGIFDANAVWKMIGENKKNKIDAAYPILSLLAIESWMIQFADNKSKSIN
jgi:asparagine synthase (glutamine-hydrolysing)